MKKLLGIVVLGLLYLTNLNANEIYLYCKQELEGKQKMIDEREYIFNKKKISLMLVRADLYLVREDGSKDRRGLQPAIFDNGFPYFFHEETNIFYIFGGGIIGNKRASIKNILDLNKKSTTKRGYTTLKLNKFNYNITKQEFGYDRLRSDFTKLIPYVPLEYHCKK